MHFSAFHPDYKILDRPPTPAATLTRARTIAIGEGLQYVYTGNVHDTAGGTTNCPHCHTPLIVRDWYAIQSYRVTSEGNCPDCGEHIAGNYEASVGHFGRKRIPIRLGVNEPN